MMTMYPAGHSEALLVAAAHSVDEHGQRFLNDKYFHDLHEVEQDLYLEWLAEDSSALDALLEALPA